MVSEINEALEEDSQELLEAQQSSEPYLGQWHQLISKTNWEKGRIISQWRAALIAENAAVTERSDQTWASMAGGVTASHVGRLRRVYDRFGDQYEKYPQLRWSHFLAAFDWDDAAMWLEGASQSGWSVANMRQERWVANGKNPDQRPVASDLVTVELDEDVVQPAQGGGRSRSFDDTDPQPIAAGASYEGPDFGEESRTGDNKKGGGAETMPTADSLDATGNFVQPFRGLPELPTDLSDAIEMVKLAILRHKAEKWTHVSSATVLQYLESMKTLVESRAD